MEKMKYWRKIKSKMGSDKQQWRKVETETKKKTIKWISLGIRFKTTNKNKKLSWKFHLIDKQFISPYNKLATFVFNNKHWRLRMSALVRRLKSIETQWKKKRFSFFLAWEYVIAFVDYTRNSVFCFQNRHIKQNRKTYTI